MDERNYLVALTRAMTYLHLGHPWPEWSVADRALHALRRATARDRSRVVSATLDEVNGSQSRPAASSTTAPPIGRNHIGYPPLTGAGRTRVPGRAGPWRWAALRRRSLMAVLVILQTLFASYFMLGALPDQRMNVLSIALVVVFAVLFAWISVGFWMAVFGFVYRLMGGDPWSPLKRHSPQALAATPLARTAIVMPIYHEPVDRCMRALRAIYRSLEHGGQLERFEFFVLSDSRDANIWLSEQTAWHELCRELGAEGRLHYRRRVVNLRHKSGNIADFLRRWGERFRYMVVLDADSAMSGDTIVRMVQLMQREPRVGILQTAPRICHAASPFALVQQFANCVYGPLFTAGLACVQLGDAAYWGHNAIIRVAPFMRHCGLRRLAGPGLFKGPILSHDFVEAACMGRAGYEVWLEPGLSASYEESPPTLLDELSRDRRWAKGNLQHLWLVLFGRQLRFAHRLALVNGVLAYAISPLWMLFLALTTAKVARFTLWPINYFPHGHRLFPLWPVWHPNWALQLAGTTAFLLFMPKVLALLDVSLRASARRLHGGLSRLLFAIVLESLASALFAPIRMVSHTRFVTEGLCNLHVRWAGQNRGEEIPWGAALRTSAPVTLFAAVWAGFAYWLQLVFFYWSLPVAVPLLLAAPMTVWLSRRKLGLLLRRHRVFLVPEQTAPPPVLCDLDTPLTHSFTPLALTAFDAAILDPRRNRLHQRLAKRCRPRQAEHLDALAHRCLHTGPSDLSSHELSMLARDARSLDWLHHAAWRAPEESPWSRRLSDIAEHILHLQPPPPPSLIEPQAQSGH